MRRFKYCSLSKYHQGPCHFEWMTWPKSEVEPRCLTRSQPISEFEYIEPSFVRRMYVPEYVNEPADKVAGRGSSTQFVDNEHLRDEDLKAVREQLRRDPKLAGLTFDEIHHDEIPPKEPFSLVREDPLEPDPFLFTQTTLIAAQGVPFGAMTLKGNEAEFRRVRDTYRSSATFAQDLYRNRRSPPMFMPPFHERHWDQHRNACEMRIVWDEEGTRFVPGRPIFRWPKGETFMTPKVPPEKRSKQRIYFEGVDLASDLPDMGGFAFPGGIHKVEHGPEYRQEVPDSFPREPTPEFQKEADVPTPYKRPKLDSFGLVLILALMLLPGCQGWLHGAELGLHGPDPRIERAVRSSHKVVLDVLEQDFEAVEQANVTDPVTGKVTRENLEKQFRLMRFKALQIETIDKLLRAIAEYNGVDLEGKAGEARSEAGERAKQLRDLLEDVAKEQGKDLADELLDGLR